MFKNVITQSAYTCTLMSQTVLLQPKCININKIKLLILYHFINTCKQIKNYFEYSFNLQLYREHETLYYKLIIKTIFNIQWTSHYRVNTIEVAAISLNRN